MPQQVETAAAFIGVGSNIAPEANIPAALRLLCQSVLIDDISTFYKTEPIGSPGSPPFYNGIFKIRVDRGGHHQLKNVLRTVEGLLGRVRGPDKNAPRPIDLDLLIYGDAVIHEPDLVAPSPDVLTRAFVAVPLLELAPDLVIPGAGSRLADVVATMSKAEMIPLVEFTNMLKRKIEDEPRES